MQLRQRAPLTVQRPTAELLADMQTPDCLVLTPASCCLRPPGGGRIWAAELEAVVTAVLLPAVPQLLALGPPLPLFTLKLLAALLEARPGWAAALAGWVVHCQH
jgi:hypothetical protein